MNLTPQLAESIDKARLPEFLGLEEWAWSQKLDGDRKLARITNGNVEMLNRRGEPESRLTAEVVQAQLSDLSGVPCIILDGEYVEGTFWIFDLPYAEGFVAPTHPYSFRRRVLDRLTPNLESNNVRVLQVARTPEEKMALSRAVIEAGGEGLMLNDNSSQYYSGKRHRGLLKAKFVKDCDAFITRFGIGKSSNGSGETKQNCELAVIDPNSPKKKKFYVHPQEAAIAECIIHPKERNQVEVGSVVTVAYLYAKNPEEPRLVQPTRLRPRVSGDKTLEECTIDQVKFTNTAVHDFRT